MDETVAEYIRRTVLKIPRDEIKTTLQKWGFLSESQLQTVNFRQLKDSISQDVVHLCEKCLNLAEIAFVTDFSKLLHAHWDWAQCLKGTYVRWTSVQRNENSADIKQAADLDVVYNHVYPNKRMWSVYQMNKTGEETDFFDFKDFKKKFKRRLRSALRNVTINFREYEDNAIWIRIAWGTPYTKPNQYKASYVVYHSQVPYVFISTSVLKSNIPLLCQVSGNIQFNWLIEVEEYYSNGVNLENYMCEALLVASNYHDIREMELRGHCLNSLKDIVFKRYSQNFQTYCPRPLPETSITPVSKDLRVVQENGDEKERILRVNREVFGDGPQPKLEFAQYKLETMFKSGPKMDVLHKKEPFRCLVKFSSPHLLESLKSLAPTGVADAPLSPLLTCIPHRARNYFKVKERKSLLPGSFVSP